MEKAYRFRIYPSESQEELIQKTFGCVRYVYNYYLAMRKKKYDEDRETFRYYACCLDLTSYKRDNSWLKEVDVTALQSSLKDLDDAYENFFRRVKNGDKPGYPKFKNKKDNHKSYKSKNCKSTIRLTEKHIRIPKVGNIKCKISKNVEGRILSATIIQVPSGKYFVSVLCTDILHAQIEKTGAVVGIDLGLKEIAITSDNCHYSNPKHLANSHKKLVKLQRKLSRKSKGSNNREKARIKMARLHEHVANQRLDNAHKMTTSLVRDYDLIAIETLSPKNMVKNHRLAKAISDAAWGEIVKQFECKCNWHGKELVKVDRFYPSSQTCNSCGYKNSDTKKLAVREWDCPKCGVHHDRDVNAAKNILDEGLRVVNAA